VLGAAGEHRDAAPSEIRIGDSIVMISEAGERPPMTAFLPTTTIAAWPRTAGEHVAERGDYLIGGSAIGSFGCDAGHGRL
jgi:hypothetical protein